MEFTAERVIPDRDELSPMYQEHLARYQFASRFIEGKTVLDAGCGCGYGSHHLAINGAKNVIGVDISSEAIDYSVHHYHTDNLEFHVMDVTKLYFPDKAFDVVVALEVFEHLENQDNHLKEVCRVLKEGGYFIVSTPNRNVFSPGMQQPLNPFHTKEFSLEEFRQKLRIYFNQIMFWGQIAEIPGPFSLSSIIRLNMLLMRALSGEDPLRRAGRMLYTFSLKVPALVGRGFGQGMKIDSSNFSFIPEKESDITDSMYFIALAYNRKT